MYSALLVKLRIYSDGWLHSNQVLYSLFFESRRIVTGPSLMDWIFMSAPNSPVSIFVSDMEANFSIK
jgi:hypothetical protein